MVLKIAYVELLISDITFAEQLFMNTLQFSHIKSSIWGNYSPSEIEYLLTSGQAKLLIKSPLSSQSYLGRKLYEKGDHISNIALTVESVNETYQQAMRHGATSVAPPKTTHYHSSPITQATFTILDGITHTIMSSEQELDGSKSNQTSQHLFEKVDHIALCVPANLLEDIANFYISAFNFEMMHAETIETGFSGMKSIVVCNQNKNVKIVLTAPINGEHESQIQEFIRVNKGPGIQHIALLTQDIHQAIEHVKQHHLDILKIPDEYYTILNKETHLDNQEMSRLKQNDILLDQDKAGKLYQAFTSPLCSKPTFFLEFIQRDGAHGFGSNNIKTLFKAKEIAQTKELIQ